MQEFVGGRNIAALHSLVDVHAIDHTNHAVQMYFVLSGFPDYRVEVDDVVADGESATVTSRYAATHRAKFLDLEATGRQVNGTRTDVFTIRDGTIHESWHDWHVPGLVSQIS